MTQVQEKSTRGMDELQKFEASMPFDNIMIGGFFKIVQEEQENEQDVIMYDKFKARISAENAEWEKALASRDTLTSKILLSPFMQDGEGISVSCLMSMALLHCPHDKNDTGKIFYQVLQGGGVEKNDFIAAADKEIPPCFNRMGKLVTTELFKIYAEFGENKYSAAEMLKIDDYITGEEEDEET